MEGEAGEYMKRQGSGGEETERARERERERERERRQRNQKRPGNGPEECKRAIEKDRGSERERGRGRGGEGGRGDCADVRGKVLRRALPDLTTPPLPTRVSSNVARSDSIRLYLLRIVPRTMGDNICIVNLGTSSRPIIPLEFRKEALVSCRCLIQGRRIAPR